MSAYTIVHKIGDREIFVDTKKKRIYARPHGSLPEDLLRFGQSALDAVIAVFAVLEPPYIDYLFDMRFGEPLAEAPFKIWKEKALEILSKYPQVCVVGIAEEDSPLWLQISQYEELFRVYGNRILGIFKTQEEAEAFLDKLRGFSD
jgi:hypothetical protein